MAENLGEAQLRLTVDLTAFQDDLRRARDLITRELGNVTRTNREAQTTARRARTEASEQQRRIDRAARQGGARESTRALEIAQEKRFRIARRIDALEEQGADVARLRLGLGRLTDAQIRRQFGSFRQLGQELARQVTLEERRFQALRRQQRQQQLAAAIGAQQGGARESVFALERAQDRRFKLSQRINRLEERGTNVSQLRTRLGELTASYAQRQFGTARQLSRELERQVALTEARARRERDVQQALQRSARIGGAREPIQGRVDLPGSPRFLEEQRRREQQALRRAAQAGGPAEPIRGRIGLDGSPRFLQEQARRRQQILERGAQLGGAAESIANFERLQQQRFRLSQRINALDAQGVETAGLRNQLSRLDAAFAERQVGSAKRLSTELSRQLDVRQAQLRVARDQQRIGGPSEPIRGRTDLPGSPRYIEAQNAAAARAAREEEQRRRREIADGLRTGRQNAVPISGLLADRTALPDSPAAKAKAQGLRNSWARFLRQLDDTKKAIDDAAQRDAQRLKGPALPVTGRLVNGGVIPGSPADIARQQRQLTPRGPSLPVSGRLINGQVVPGSPADLNRNRGGISQRQRQLQDAAGSAIIGGAFPLLFGQGLGASLGGGLGGLGGGALGGQFGFGLSLVGTAVGAQFDQASQKLQTLGSALNDPIGKFGELQQAGLLSSKGLERQIQALIDTGRQAEAAALIQKDLATTYGDLQAAKGLARQSDELNRSWTRLTVTLADLGISPLVSLLGETSNAVQGFALAIKTLRDALPNLPTPFGTPKEISQNLTSQGGITGGLARFAGDYAKNFQRILFSNAFLPGSGVDTVLRLGSGLGQVLGATKPTTAPATAANEANAQASTKARQQLLAVTRQLIASEAQNNTTLTTGLKLRQSQLQEAQAIANLTETNPQARQVRIEEVQRAGNEERTRLREQAREAERSGIRDLGRARQLVGVYGTQRQIKEEQLKLDEARRVAEQAQQSFNKSATKDKGEENALNAAILKYRQTELEVTENIRRLEAERWANAIAAANQIVQLQRQTAIEQQRPNFTGTGIGVLQSLDARQAAVEAQRVAEARLAVEPGNEQLQQAAQAAAEQVKAAASKTRSDLIAAYNAAKDATQSISRSIQDAVLALQRSRNTRGQGINQFLSPQQVSDRQQQVAREQQPVLGGLLQRFTQLTGIQPQFQLQGNIEQVNALRSDAITAFQQEIRAIEDIRKQRDIDLVTATNDLSIATAALNDTGISIASTMPQLIENISKLASKDWGVNVSVDSQGGVKAFGDVLTGALS